MIMPEALLKAEDAAVQVLTGDRAVVAFIAFATATICHHFPPTNVDLEDRKWEPGLTETSTSSTTAGAPEDESTQDIKSVSNFDQEWPIGYRHSTM